MKYFEEIEKPKKQKTSFPFDALSNTHIGVLLTLPILLCLTIGIVCDSLFATKPTFTVVFLFFGAFLSLASIYKIARQKHGENRTTRQH